LYDGIWRKAGLDDVEALVEVEVATGQIGVLSEGHLGIAACVMEDSEEAAVHDDLPELGGEAEGKEEDGEAGDPGMPGG